MALTRPRLGQLTTTVSSLSDPITVLNGGSTSANVDVGFLMNRANGLLSNVALYWSESGNTFVTAFTSNTGITNSNIAVTGYANITTGSILPGANVTYNLGSSTQRWKDLWLSGTTIYLGGATISSPDNNTIVLTNPAGASFSVTGTAAGQASGTFGNLIANSGVASTSTSTGALQIIGGAGISGNVYVAGNIVQTGTSYNTIPVGTTDQRPVTPTSGMIRYNSTLSSFEGYGVAWSSLGGVKSVDGQTYILAEATTGAGDDTLWFYNNSVLTANLTTTKFSLLQGTASTSTSTGALVVAGGAGISGDVYVGGDIVANGNLIVNGTTTNINTTNLVVEDKNIIVADVATPTNITADGAGITVKGDTDKTFNWVNATSAWTSSEDLNLLTGKQFEINGTSVLTATTLGSGVVNSSLTSLGTIATLVATDSRTTTGVVTNFSSGNIVATNSTSGTWSTANVSLYESVTASTTNATFYPMLSDKTSGNTSSFSATTLTHNPSTGNLTVVGLIGTHWGPVAATTANVSSTLAVTGTSTFTGATNHAGGITASTVSAGTIGNTGATLTGTVSTAAQPNITAVGTLTSLAVSGATTAAAITSTGTIIASTLNAGTIGNTGATLTGTLNTAAQPNITSLGTLSGLTTSGDVTVGGNLTVQGNTVTIGSNNLTVTDSIIGLHTFANGAPLISDDGRDIGLRFHYYKGVDKHAFLGWENNLETLVWYANATEVSSNVTGTLGNVQFGSLTLSNTTPSSSTTTGALIVAGGAGIGGSLYIANTGDVSANIGTLYLSNISTNANLGAYQVFANANSASQATAITSLATNANTNTAAYLSGAISTGALTVTGHVLPSANITYDLGSPTQRWKDLYLSGNTMVLGQANIQAHSSGITIYAPNQTVNLNQNLHTTATPSFANVTATGNLIVSARLRDYTGNAGLNGQLLASTGTGVQWVTRDTGTLESLTDVNLSAPQVQQVLTYDGTNWVNADSNATVASAVFASSQSDLGFVTDLVLTIIEDEGSVADVANNIYDLGVLSFTGIISLNNIDQSIKSDYLGYSIIFGF
jgi:hypothetical protein